MLVSAAFTVLLLLLWFLPGASQALGVTCLMQPGPQPNLGGLQGRTMVRDLIHGSQVVHVSFEDTLFLGHGAVWSALTSEGGERFSECQASR